jgi:polyphosphate kinase
VLGADDVDPHEHQWLLQQFEDRLFPVLTPLAVDPAHPFPFIPNLGFALALKLKRRTDGRTLYALLPRPHPGGALLAAARALRRTRRASLEGSPIHSARRGSGAVSGPPLSGMEVIAQGGFNVVRDSDIELEEEAEDLVREFEALLKTRRHGLGRSASRSTRHAGRSAQLHRGADRG